MPWVSDAGGQGGSRRRVCHRSSSSWELFGGHQANRRQRDRDPQEARAAQAAAARKAHLERKVERCSSGTEAEKEIRAHARSDELKAANKAKKQVQKYRQKAKRAAEEESMARALQANLQAVWDMDISYIRRQ